MLVHTVVFWLKDNLSSSDREFFFSEVKTLGAISSVKEFHIGTPASTPDRPVVENSYHCSLSVVLKDLAAHDQYQEDPIHLAFIEKCKDLWDKVIIYDAD